MNRNISVARGTLLAAFLALGCVDPPVSGEGSDAGGGDPSDPRAVVTADIGALARLDPSALAAWNTAHYSRFQQVFGGVTPAAVRAYLDARLRYYYRPTDDIVVTPPLTARGWAGDPNGAAESLPNNVRVGAANVGATLWLSGLLDGVALTVAAEGERYPVASGRTGIMLIGGGYITSITDSKGRSYPVPTALRQSILMHEARHSDCTGGLTQADLEVARAAGTAQEFDARWTSQCLHLHTLCRTGDYQGLPACDRYPWEAYTVGAVFLDAALQGLEPTSVAYQILQVYFIDSGSRGVNYRALIDGAGGTPDMSDAPEVR